MPTRALIIKSPWADWVVLGSKTIEIRTFRTNKVGKEIYIAKSGTKSLIGKVTIDKCVQLTLNDYINLKNKHLAYTFITDRGWHEELFNNKKIYAWFLINPIAFKDPISYNHPIGAQVWVKIDF